MTLVNTGLVCEFDPFVEILNFDKMATMIYFFINIGIKSMLSTTLRKKCCISELYHRIYLPQYPNYEVKRQKLLLNVKVPYDVLIVLNRK